MVKSQGILGLQLDERRLANEDTIKGVKKSLFRNKIMHYRSELALETGSVYCRIA